MKTAEILARLIGFDTTSSKPNRALMDWVQELLAGAGIRAQIIPDASGTKANLFATIGPQDRPGVMLSGHTDVVPVEGQVWTRPPFLLTEADGRYYGRGTTDMKGFVACALAAALAAARRPLATPLHLALSYDEEVGCLGVASLIDLLAQAPHRPVMCIVGEPTGLQVATGHKGKIALRATCTGREGHSALAPMALNALHLGADFLGALRRLQDEVAQNGLTDGDYDVPYTTLHVGKMQGGVQVNIVPNSCTLDFEIRNLAGDDPQVLIDLLRVEADRITGPLKAAFPEAAITIDRLWDYPGLGTPTSAPVVQFVKSLTGANGTMKVAFGTEGGLFSTRLGIPTVICGPGSIDQAHQPDEYVDISQMQRGAQFMRRLIEWASEPL